MRKAKEHTSTRAEVDAECARIQSEMGARPGVKEAKVWNLGFTTAAMDPKTIAARIVFETGADRDALAEDVLHRAWTSTVRPLQRVVVETIGDANGPGIQTHDTSLSDKGVQGELTAKYGPRPS